MVELVMPTPQWTKEAQDFGPRKTNVRVSHFWSCLLPSRKVQEREQEIPMEIGELRKGVKC